MAAMADTPGIEDSGRGLTDLSVDPSRGGVAERDELMDAARRILDVHRADPDNGSCTGCLAQWNRWIWTKDCAQQSWAQSIMEMHGAIAGLDESLLANTVRVP